MTDTKEEILHTALHLFARDGYEAVSVSQIAGALGITKGALYRHYESKRDIFLHIIARMEQQDAQQAESDHMPGSDAPAEQYACTSRQDFLRYSKAMFAYWTEDNFAASFRRMLTLEQFRSDEMQQLYGQYLVSGPMHYVKDLFVGFGVADAQAQAARFYGLMFFYYALYDGSSEKAPVTRQLEQQLDRLADEIFK